MFWNKKEEKDSLPDLPPMKPAFQVSQSAVNKTEDGFGTSEKNNLPAFPDSPVKRGFAQAAVKDAISNYKEDEDNEIISSPNEEKSFRIVEMEDESAHELQGYSKKVPSQFQKGAIPEIPEASIKFSATPGTKGSDMFIKIDKFYSAKKALSSTQEQIESIESVLKKIRETKMREEQELASWEKEILQAKSRIQEIAKSIFEKS